MISLLSLEFVVTYVRMSHLLNQTWYLETSFCLISLPEPFFLFLSLCFAFTHLCLALILQYVWEFVSLVFLQSSFHRSILCFDGISQCCCLCDTLEGYCKPFRMLRKCIFLTLEWHYCDIVILILWHTVTFFLMADSDDLLSTVKDKVQSCLIFWWLLGTGQTDVKEHYVREGLGISLSDGCCTL